MRGIYIKSFLKVEEMIWKSLLNNYSNPYFGGKLKKKSTKYLNIKIAKYLKLKRKPQVLKHIKISLFFNDVVSQSLSK